jgi:hypothetical protein
VSLRPKAGSSRSSGEEAYFDKRGGARSPEFRSRVSVRYCCYNDSSGDAVKRIELSKILNRIALSLLFAYLAGILLLIFAAVCLRLENEFWILFRYLLWGGVSLLVTIYFLMMAKLLTQMRK